MKKVQDISSVEKVRPALSPEAEESQMISLAVKAAKRQLLDGTASAQVITHYLRLGTERAKLEREDLAQTIELKRAKTEAYKSAKHIEELYANAIAAMRTYRGE